MKKELIFSIIVVALLTLMVVYFSSHPATSQSPSTEKVSTNDKSVTFGCPKQGTFIKATFHLPEDKTVDISLSDGRTMTLPRAISASGARYANSDESLVFWNKGDTAFMMEGGVVTLQDCVIVQ